MTYKPFGWDQDDPESFRPLELNRTVERGRAPHAGDIHNLATAFDATGDYDMGRDGRPPLVPERLFGAIERFQARENLDVDGVMEPGGPTVTRLNALQPEAMDRPTPTVRQAGPPARGDDDPTFDDAFRALREAGRPPIIGPDFDGAVEVGRRAHPEPRRDEPTPLAATASPPGARAETPPGHPLLPGEPEPASRSDMPEPALILLTDLERAGSDDEVETRVAVAPAILPIVLPFVLRAAAQATPWAVRALPHIQRAIQAGRAVMTVGRTATSVTADSRDLARVDQAASAPAAPAGNPDQTEDRNAETSRTLWADLERAFAGVAPGAVEDAVAQAIRALEARAQNDGRGDSKTTSRTRRAIEICEREFASTLDPEVARRVVHTGGGFDRNGNYRPEQNVRTPRGINRPDANWHLLEEEEFRRFQRGELTIDEIRRSRAPDVGFNNQRGRASGNPIRAERDAMDALADAILAFEGFVNRRYPHTPEGDRRFDEDIAAMCRRLARGFTGSGERRRGGGDPPAQSLRELTDLLY